jgi:hypothetical protein
LSFVITKDLAIALEKQAMFWQDQNACFGYPQKYFDSLCSSIIMARPTIYHKEKRAIRFTFRLNDREEKWLNYLTSYSNRSKADVIRDLVFKKRILKPKIPKLDQQTYGELKRIGINLNQVAKKLNANATAPETEKTIAELKKKLIQILQQLLHDR